MSTYRQQKASITYKVDGRKQYIAFHATIEEDHEINTQLTEFPVQTGFSISNHTIKKNKKFKITGLISNIILSGQIDYGTSDNTALMHETFQTLVRNSTVCEVITNLGIYSPVVFTKYKNNQKAGTMDSLPFTLIGEELMVKGSLNNTAPKKINFQVTKPSEYQGLIDKLKCQGIDVPEGAELSQATVKEGESFSITTTTLAGVSTAMTYIAGNKDSSTGNTSYEAHTSDTDYYVGEEDSSFSVFGLDSVAATRGINTASTCISGGIDQLANDLAADFIDTQLGKLESSLYGAKQEIINMGGSDAGQALIGLGMDCVVAGVASSLTEPEEVTDNSSLNEARKAANLDPCNAETPERDLPDVNDIIFGLSDNNGGYQTLTKIVGGDNRSTGRIL